MYNKYMRTTIEIRPEHRAKLLELAARRGEKGFSSLVDEALQAYLETDLETERVRRRALRARGTLSPKEAQRMRRTSAALREFWR